MDILKKLFIGMIIFAMLGASQVFGASTPVKFSWGEISDPQLESYNLFIRERGFNYLSDPDYSGLARNYETTLDDGIYFSYVSSSYTEGPDSLPSDEIRFEVRDGQQIWASNYFNQDHRGIQFTLPVLDSDLFGNTLHWDNNEGSHELNLEEKRNFFLRLSGSNVVKINPYNSYGEEFKDWAEEENVLISSQVAQQFEILTGQTGFGTNTQVLIGAGIPVEYQGTNWELIVKFSSSRENLLLENYDLGQATYSNTNSIIYNVDSTVYDIVHFAVWMQNIATVEESDKIIAYELFGNIIGTWNEGVPYYEAEVNYQDANALAINYLEKILNRPNDWQNLDLYQFLPSLYIELCDSNNDGLIDFWDINWFRAMMFHKGEE